MLGLEFSPVLRVCQHRVLVHMIVGKQLPLRLLPRLSHRTSPMPHLAGFKLQLAMIMWRALSSYRGELFELLVGLFKWRSCRGGADYLFKKS